MSTDERSDQTSTHDPSGPGEPESSAPAAPPAEPLLNDVVPPPVSRHHAVLRVALGLAVTGVAVGALWAWIAPTTQVVVVLARSGERVQGYVGTESSNLFLAPFILVGLLTVSAIVWTTVAWRWREHRSPDMVAGLTLGALATAGAAAGVGAVLARWRYGTFDLQSAPVTPEARVHYVMEAPAVFFGHSGWQIALTIVFPAGIAALMYAICALSASRDDLGAWPPGPATGRAPRAAVDPTGVPSSPEH